MLDYTLNQSVQHEKHAFTQSYEYPSNGRATAPQRERFRIIGPTAARNPRDADRAANISAARLHRRESLQRQGIRCAPHLPLSTANPWPSSLPQEISPPADFSARDATDPSPVRGKTSRTFP